MSKEEQVRVLIVDDHAVVREGLAFLASVHNEIEIVGQAENGIEAVELASALKPDVIVLDLLMPEMDGIEAIKRIKENDPNARILVLSSFSDEERILAAIKSGAAGYLLKDSSPKEVIQGVLAVHRGESPLHSTVAKKLMNELKDESKSTIDEVPLTDRELEVLKLVALGLTNRDISNQLSLSIRTVGVHVGNILGKLNLGNRTQAALYALEKGLSKPK